MDGILVNPPKKASLFTRSAFSRLFYSDFYFLFLFFVIYANLMLRFDEATDLFQL